MDYSKCVLVLCLIAYARASVSVQDDVDKVLSNINNRVEFIENNPALVNRIYCYFQEQYPGGETMQMLSFRQPERLEIFKSNLKYVIEHNSNPSATFKLKINKMSDWTNEEKDQLRAKIDVQPLNNEPPVESRDQSILPVEYDLDDSNTHSQCCNSDQESAPLWFMLRFCHGWSFGKDVRTNLQSIDPLSPQQLIDCSDESGCEGGSVVGTFNDIKRNGDRLSLEKDYPSTADGKQQEKCQNTNGTLLSFNATATLSYQQLPAGNEDYMKKVLYQKGPIYVYFNCGKRDGNDTILRETANKFDHYASGVFDVPGCPTHRNMNHALVVVGYGTDNGIDYWKV